MKRKKTIVALILLIICIIVVSIIIYAVSAKQNSSSVPEYEEYEVTTGSIAQVISLSGTIEPANTAQIYNKTSYSIVKDNYKEGDWVNKGDVLYELSTSEVEQKIKEAEFELKKAQENYSYYQKESQNYGIYSLTKGKLVAINIKVGDYVQNGSIIGTISNYSMPIISFVLENEIISSNISDDSQLSVYHKGVVYKAELKNLKKESNISNSDITESSCDVIKGLTLMFSDEINLKHNDIVTVNVDGNNYKAIVSEITYEKDKIIADKSGVVKEIKKSVNNYLAYGDIILTLTSEEIQHNLNQYKILLQEAQAEYETQKRELDLCVIKSPIDGKILKKYENSGYSYNNTEANTPIMIISDTSSYSINALASPKDVQLLQIGQKAKITSDIIKDLSITGTITNISSVQNDEVDTDGYDVIISPDNFNGGVNYLDVDVYVDIDILQKDNVLIIPKYYISDDNTVYVKDDDSQDRFSKVTVQTGIANNEYVEIISGLDAGTTLIYFTNVEEDDI